MTPKTSDGKRIVPGMKVKISSNIVKELSLPSDRGEVKDYPEKDESGYLVSVYVRNVVYDFAPRSLTAITSC